MPVVLPAPDTGLRQPAEQTAWTAPSPSCRIVVEWVTTTGVLPVNDRTAHHAHHPPGTRGREVTSLASSPVSLVSAHAWTWRDPATLAVSAAPGTSRSPAVPVAAMPAPARIRMCGGDHVTPTCFPGRNVMVEPTGVTQKRRSHVDP